jgi:hypothetical protein
MNPLYRVTRVLVLLLLSLATCTAQDLDGPKHIFTDPLLENLVGEWTLTGKVAGRTADHTVQAEWILNHQFLRIHEKDSGRLPPADQSQKGGTAPYEAIVMVGYDNTSLRYVTHWTDIYGGRFSETLGYGARDGNKINFVFEYPDGPFHTTFSWKPDTHEWQWLMQTRNKAGDWVEFANLTLVRHKN